MSAGEWDGLHPLAAECLLEAHEARENRTEIRIAYLKLLIAQAMGVKIMNREARLRDFLPENLKDDGTAALMAEWEKNR